MKTRCLRFFATASLAILIVSCQSVKPSTGTLETNVKPVEPSVYSGNVSHIDQAGHLVTVKMLWRKKTFQVLPDCEIVARKKPRGTLEDLNVGDPVEVAFVQAENLPVAHRIAVKGVTPAEKQEAVQEEHIEKILTPSPSERPIDPVP